DDIASRQRAGGQLAPSEGIEVARVRLPGEGEVGPGARRVAGPLVELAEPEEGRVAARARRPLGADALPQAPRGREVEVLVGVPAPLKDDLRGVGARGEIRQDRILERLRLVGPSVVAEVLNRLPEPGRRLRVRRVSLREGLERPDRAVD